MWVFDLAQSPLAADLCGRHVDHKGKNLVLIFSTNTSCENMAYRSGPLGLRNIQLEVSEKLPQG